MVPQFAASPLQFPPIPAAGWARPGCLIGTPGRVLVWLLPGRTPTRGFRSKPTARPGILLRPPCSHLWQKENAHESFAPALRRAGGGGYSRHEPRGVRGVVVVRFRIRFGVKLGKAGLRRNAARRRGQ